MKLNAMLTLAGLVVAAAVPVLAHHSLAAEFDSTKPVTIKGKLTKLEWMNPHIWMYLDVKDEKGNMVKWQCEGAPPNTLTRAGWGRDDVKIGDELTIEGLLSKTGEHTCNSANITLPSGRKVLTRAQNDGK